MDVVFETTEGRAFSMEVWFFATVLEMKEKIHKYHGFQVSRQTLVFDGRVMQDDRDTEHYGVLQGSRIRLFLEPPGRPAAVKEEERAVGRGAAHERSEVGVAPPRARAFSAAPQSKRLRLMVVPPKGGTRKMPVEVNGSDNVSELRKELKRQVGGFELPTEGYFFIYKQNVMDEDHTFRWHDVRQGDTIEIFNGSVTSG